MRILQILEIFPVVHGACTGISHIVDDQRRDRSERITAAGIWIDGKKLDIARRAARPECGIVL